MMFAANLLFVSAALNSPALQGGGDPNQFNGFMVLGYVAMWLIVMIYLVTMK